MSTLIDLDAISAGLQAVANLRCEVNQLFYTLTNGFGGPMIDPTTYQPRAKDADEEAEIKFITDIKQNFDIINNQIKKLEKSCEHLNQNTSNTINLNIGMLGILAQDPAHERDGLYANLISCYRWFDRMHDYVSHAHHFYNMNNIYNRNVQGSDTLLRMKQMSNNYKPLKIAGRSTALSGINMPSNQIDIFFNSLTRNIPNLSLKIVRPFGSPTIAIFTLDKVLKSLLLLHGLIIEWVVVKGIDEDFYDENGKLDIWSESRYEIFKKVSINCISATHHFSSPIHYDIAVKSWMNWFASYQTLFNKPCLKCHQRININYKLPTWRDYRTSDAYHEDCHF
ncbi:mediator of RNA polymerase II transcription subunit 27-like [Panonychus citri]|uniref:mediator of RNA polymerase II transcription subunit 27-like n=1 Tax=Panonychus citri TaxID=50023 RepID=UPI0023076522|nr:mediator of RNA polymerase II transcription subunit 27-like [Panonychus citri]